MTDCQVNEMELNLRKQKKKHRNSFANIKQSTVAVFIV